MTSLSTVRRQIKQVAARHKLERRTDEAILAAANYTDLDRAVAESLEAKELLDAFLAEEI
jgi:hypothetical protein